MPDSHAYLSASSSSRWLHCSICPRLEAPFPNKSSIFAEEGTAAHAMFAGMGAFLGWFFGGFDGFFYALVVFVTCDYFTGVLATAVRHELSSEVGFKGIAKKVCIFILVGISSVIDTQIIGEGAALRTALIFWAISNEGLSILENCAVIGLPVPEKLKAMLIQLVDENHAAKLNGKTSEEKKQ